MNQIEILKHEMQDVLERNILRFWLDKMTDHENGGYYGRISGKDEIDAHADKGAILNARILWSFSAAYRVLGKPEYLEAATRAKRYIIDKFIDKEWGGVYWCLDYQGNPIDTKKQTYAIGFAIYGLSEYARATNDNEAFEWAKRLFDDVETHAFDQVNNGYIEALTRDWKPIADMRLSDKDENGSKTMNTHLHIIEPYTNLLRIWKDERLEMQVRNLLDIFMDKILNPKTNHLDLFFNDEWQGKRNIQSFGHDIEAAWLLHETALVLNDKTILTNIDSVIQKIAKAADEGLQEDGSMIYERWIDSNKTDNQRQWWVLCECIIGHYDLYQYFHDTNALNIVFRCWEYIKNYLIDNEKGEWHWGVTSDGNIIFEDDKAGFWKCPYHNSRMCLELMERS